MSTAFDQSAADAQVHALGESIVQDANYAGRDWRGIALVVEVAPRKRMYGFVYDADGEAEAETPDDLEIINAAGTLADTMAGDGNRWGRCLVQIARAPGDAPKLKVDFDYDGAADWTVTPGNHAAQMEKLRPAL